MLSVGKAPSPVRLCRDPIVLEPSLGEPSLNSPYHTRLRRNVCVSNTDGQSNIGQRL